jgi:putative FmdB family regulatory protein
VPTYDYACTVCGTRVEVIHGVHDEGPTTCSACGGPVRKAVSAPAIVFKGSGWAKKERASSRPSPKPSDDGADRDSSKPPAAKPSEDSTARPAKDEPTPSSGDRDR